MFGGSTNPSKEKTVLSPISAGVASTPINNVEDTNTSTTPSGREKRNSSLLDSPKRSSDKRSQTGDKKRRNSSVTKAAALFASAKSSLHLSSSRDTQREVAQTPLQALARMDPALIVPQGSLNNSAGDSVPTPQSSFRVGVTEDRNKKCRRTMEDTHAYLYNFLGTPIPSKQSDQPSQSGQQSSAATVATASSEDSTQVVETDNGYFSIFDGHAGTFAAEWCGKKLHLILEEIMRKNPTTPVPILLDQTFTTVDQQLEQLPLRNSGCTAVTAVLRWEDRASSSTIPAPDTAGKKPSESDLDKENASKTASPEASLAANASPKPEEPTTTRSRVLYTANVGDARIILCRNGKALRLSYDHKGSDENEGIRITNAGGLILNNRVNGVLAVTRALGDTYMKDLVTGHPFTTETTIHPDTDEFLILACDGLWDVCSDQEAVDLVRDTQDAQAASKILVDHALSRFSTDNLSCMIVRFDTKATAEEIRRKPTSKGSEPNTASSKTAISEADNIVEMARKTANQTGTPTSPDSCVLEDDSPQIEPVIKALNEEPGPDISTTDKSNTEVAVSDIQNTPIAGGENNKPGGLSG